MDATRLKQIRVRPALEIAAKSFVPQEGSAGQRFAQRVLQRSEMGNAVETPDGWFVPLAEVLSDLDGAADFLYHEAVHWGEVEFCGGLELWIGDSLLLPIPSSSSFRFALDFGHAILHLQNDSKPQNVFIGNDDYVVLSIEDQNLIMAPIRSKILIQAVHLPYDAVCLEMERALADLELFRERLLAVWNGCDLSAEEIEHTRWLLSADET